MRSASFKPYFSAQQIENGRARSAAQRRAAAEFASAGEAALPGALQQLTGGMDTLSGEAFKELTRKRNELRELDLLKTVQDELAADSAFMDDFEKNNQGRNGVNAGEAYAAFRQERDREVMGRWHKDEAAMRYLQGNIHYMK